VLTVDMCLLTSVTSLFFQKSVAVLFVTTGWCIVDVYDENHFLRTVYTVTQTQLHRNETRPVRKDKEFTLSK